MVDKFSKSEKEIEIDCSIIPRLQAWNEITLQKGDTLVAYINEDIFDIDFAKGIYEILEKTFPENQIVVLPRAVELGVIKNG